MIATNVWCSMNSTQLKNIRKNFSEWHPFNEQYLKKAPERHGIYVIRKSEGQCFGRLRGKSDILYIGSTEAKGGLRQRLRQYLHPGPTQWTNKRINKLLIKYKMEVAWCTCNESGNLEHQLLREYLTEHDELPPLNHATKRLLRKVLKETLQLTDRSTESLNSNSNINSNN